MAWKEADAPLIAVVCPLPVHVAPQIAVAMMRMNEEDEDDGKRNESRETLTSAVAQVGPHMPTAHKEFKEEDSVRQMHQDRKMYPSKEVTRGLEVAVSVLPPSYMDASVDNTRSVPGHEQRH